MSAEYHYIFAHKAADYILQLLKPHCERIHLAGSIRRIRPLVKDIEIVCLPKKELKQSDLFGDAETITDRNFTEALATITDIVIVGNVEGRYMKIRTTSKNCPGICLDLFMPQPHDYYRIYAIRTGSAEYAQAYIAAAWKKKGWVGTPDGLRKREECIEKSSTWHCVATNPTLPPVWDSEAAFFKWLGVEYADPEYRQLHKPINEAL